MPPLPSEQTLVTLFTDVHYYFSQPNASPLHHRFDRGSYVYIYHNALQRRVRLELANYAGTPQQDACDGYLDNAVCDFSFKQPNLINIQLRNTDQSQWGLPAYDLKNEGKWRFQVLSLDLYLWTAQDATKLRETLTQVLDSAQMVVRDAPPPAQAFRPPSNTVSGLVQHLENAAISSSTPVTQSGTPAPEKGSGSTPVRTSTMDGESAGPVPDSLPGSPPFSSNSQTVGQQIPPPPQTAPAPSGTPAPAGTALPGSNPTPPISGPSPPPGNQTGAAPAAPAFVPLAYNPAAPAAPEPIAVREKTPPPPDAGSGTGLNVVERNEHGVPQHPVPGMYGAQGFPPPPAPPQGGFGGGVPGQPGYAAPPQQYGSPPPAPPAQQPTSYGGFAPPPSQTPAPYGGPAPVSPYSSQSGTPAPQQYGQHAPHQQQFQQSYQQPPPQPYQQPYQQYQSTGPTTFATGAPVPSQSAIHSSVYVPNAAEMSHMTHNQQSGFLQGGDLLSQQGHTVLAAHNGELGHQHQQAQMHHQVLQQHNANVYNPMVGQVNAAARKGGSRFGKLLKKLDEKL